MPPERFGTKCDVLWGWTRYANRVVKVGAAPPPGSRAPAGLHMLPSPVSNCHESCRPRPWDSSGCRTESCTSDCRSYRALARLQHAGRPHAGFRGTQVCIQDAVSAQFRRAVFGLFDGGGPHRGCSPGPGRPFMSFHVTFGGPTRIRCARYTPCTSSAAETAHRDGRAVQRRSAASVRRVSIVALANNHTRRSPWGAVAHKDRCLAK